MVWSWCRPPAAITPLARPPLRFRPSMPRLPWLPVPAPLSFPHRRSISVAAASSVPPLDLTEDNIRIVLEDAKTELAQVFDESVGITGMVDLAELDGPFVKLRLKGRFWHKRSTVVERLGKYLQNRIPEILEVEIEDENQLDDSPASF